MRKEYFWALITLVVAIVLAIILFSILRDDKSGAEPLKCIDSELREKVRLLAMEGLDSAFRDRSQRLFEVWMSDEHDQPRRAQLGMQMAIRGYVHARDLELKWNPPACQ